MPHLDKHWITGVLVGLELFAVSVEEDGLGPQDQHNVIGIRSCAQRIREVLVEWQVIDLSVNLNFRPGFGSKFVYS